MKTLVLLALAILPLTAVFGTEEVLIRFVPAPAKPVSRPVEDEGILRAIRAAESQDNPSEIGKQGERGAYQFRRGTWTQYTHAPFSAAHTNYAHEVATAHLNWIRDSLSEAGIESTPYRIAMCWNAGLSAVVRGRVPRSALNYARRVAALTHDFQQ